MHALLTLGALLALAGCQRQALVAAGPREVDNGWDNPLIADVEVEAEFVWTSLPYSFSRFTDATLRVDEAKREIKAKILESYRNGLKAKPRKSTKDTTA